MNETLQSVFDAFWQGMLRAEGGMDVATDEAGNLTLKTSWTEPSKAEPAWFGAVQLKKSYVSCPLMPLYNIPSMREKVSPDLRKRMQGKSCFNFEKIEPELLDELERPTPSARPSMRSRLSLSLTNLDQLSDLTSAIGRK